MKHSADSYSTLRKSITPGTIAIMLAGRFRGRRVIVLKQLPKNGPLVITGPFKINGVPLRRVDPSYLIATSTKVDVHGVDVSKVTKETFQRPKQEKRVKSEGDFMGDKAKAKAEAAAKKTSKAQKAKSPNAGKVSNERPCPPEVDRRCRYCQPQEGQARQREGWLPPLGLHDQA